MTAAFKHELVTPILDGSKIHTFRKGQRWRLGLNVQFVINNRTPQRAEFRDPTPLVSWQPTELTTEGFRIDNRLLDPLELTLLAKQDGFATSEQLLGFFAKRELPLKGQLLHWTPFRYLMPDADETPECVADYLTRVAMAQQGATLDAAICRQYLRKLGEALLRENVRCTTANVLVGTQIGLDGCLVDVAGQPPTPAQRAVISANIMEFDELLTPIWGGPRKWDWADMEAWDLGGPI